MRGGLRLEELAPAPQGLRARVRVPKRASAFEGHFPGRPLLPGVALILMVADLASEQASRALVPVRLPRVRFLAPLGPGAVLGVALKGERFTVEAGDGLAAEGSLTLAPGAAASGPPVAWPQDVGTEPALPHRGAARLVDRAEEGRVLARIPAGSPLLRDGRVPACAVLEAAAQGAASLAGEGAARERAGMLVRVGEAAFPAVLLPADLPFEVELAAEGALPPLRRFLFRAVLGAATSVGTVTLRT